MENETHDCENTDGEIDEDDLYELDKMSLHEKEWRKHAFEIEIQDRYDIKSLNIVKHMHRNKVNSLYECNLLHAILILLKSLKYKHPLLTYTISMY